MDNVRRFSKFFLYSAFIIVIFLTGEYYRELLRIEIGRTFNPYPLLIFSVVFPVIFGILLAVPHLVREVRKQGKLQFDWVKSLAIIIPALYILLAFPLQWAPNLLPLRQFLYPYLFPSPNGILGTVMTNPLTLSFVGLGIGYFGLTGFFKEDVK